jgi:hemerythrin-like domain-containing protein
MPIKRNSNIVELSRDHHFGLLFCWKIKEGIKLNIDESRINNYINFFWDSHLEKHFLEEEDLLFKKIQDDLCQKAMNEHQIIKNKISLLKIKSEQAQHHYLELITLINQHIRFEERVLFPHLEMILSEEELNKIGENLKKGHQEIFVDNFSDEFWLKN